MKKVNDNKPFRSVQLRDLTPEDSKVIKEAMKITNEKRASQALLKAAKQLPGFIDGRIKQGKLIDKLSIQNNYLKHTIEKHIDHHEEGVDLQQKMRILITKMNKELDTTHTRIS